MAIDYEIVDGELRIANPDNKSNYAGCRWINGRDIEEWSEGEFCEPGWLYTDNVKSPMSYGRTDTMDYVQSQVDGKYYDSKAKLRQHYNDHKVVEVGNDWKPPVREPITPGNLERDISTAIDQLTANSPTKRKGKKKR